MGFFFLFVCSFVLNHCKPNYFQRIKWLCWGVLGWAELLNLQNSGICSVRGQGQFDVFATTFLSTGQGQDAVCGSSRCDVVGCCCGCVPVWSHLELYLCLMWRWGEWPLNDSTWSNSNDPLRQLNDDVSQTPLGVRKQCLAVEPSSLIVWIHNPLGGDLAMPTITKSFRWKIRPQM